MGYYLRGLLESVFCKVFRRTWSVALNKVFEMLNRDSISDARWVGQGGFLAAFNEDHIDDPDNSPGICIENRTAAVSGIGSCIQLQDVKAASFDLSNLRHIQLARIATWNNNRGNCRNDASMGHRCKT